MPTWTKSASAGLSIKGASWNRPNDTLGLAGIINGISRVHQHFFAAGGNGILAGDGALNYGWEKALETYYNFRFGKASAPRSTTSSSAHPPSTATAARSPSSARDSIGNFEAARITLPPRQPLATSYPAFLNSLFTNHHSKFNSPSQTQRPRDMRPDPIAPDAGTVRSHAQTMRSARVQFSALKRFAQPTPMMAVVMTCVVETDSPSLAGHHKCRRRGRFRRESVHRAQTHHLPPQRLDYPPAADVSAVWPWESRKPIASMAEPRTGCAQERQPGGRVLEAALCACHVAGQRDQPHFLLGCSRSQCPAHVVAQSLQFAKSGPPSRVACGE